mgnify:CR=1 FL=1
MLTVKELRVAQAEGCLAAGRSGYPWYPPCKIRGSRGRLRPRETFHHEAGRFDADREAVEALFHACEPSWLHLTFARVNNGLPKLLAARRG